MCTWALAGTRSVITPDGNAQVWLENYYDGCHHHYYRAQIQNRRSSGDIYSAASIRVWVCGTYEGSWEWNDTLTPGQIASHDSPTFAYGITCGAQADNYNTCVTTPTTYCNPTTYLNF